MRIDLTSKCGPRGGGQDKNGVLPMADIVWDGEYVYVVYYLREHAAYSRIDYVRASFPSYVLECVVASPRLGYRIR